MEEKQKQKLKAIVLVKIFIIIGRARFGIQPKNKADYFSSKDIYIDKANQSIVKKTPMKNISQESP